MPYPNYHAARVKSPGDFARIVVLQTLPNGIMIYGGPLKSNPSGPGKPQSYRFPKSKFTPAEAKKWLADHNIKSILFEPAAINASEYSQLEDWFQVAKTGKFPQGDLTEEIFEQLEANFNPAEHEPPVTLGHIKSESHNDKPAMAWLSDVRKVGNRLYVKARQVWDKFDGMVKDGRFKKRSIGLRPRPDGSLYLHHVAFLGSMTPAVQGLPDIYTEFQNYNNSDADKQKDNFLFEGDELLTIKKGGKKMGKEYSDEEIQKIKDDAAATAKTDAEKDTEKKVEEAKEAGKEEGKKEAEKEFSDKQEAAKRALQTEKEVDDYISEGEKKGIFTPAMRKAGLKNLLYSLAKGKAEINYSEGDKEIKTDSYSLAKKVFDSFAAALDGEIEDPANSDGKGDKNYAAEQKRAREIQKERKDAGNEITYGEALKEARLELGSKQE